MLETTVNKTVRVVGFFIQTDDISDAILLEVREIVLGGMLLGISCKIFIS